MPPGVYNIGLYRGDTYKAQFALWRDSKKTLESDLTGVLAQSQIRNKLDGTVLAEFACTVTMPNIVDIVLDPSVWTTWPSTTNKGVWDLQLTYADGDVQTVVAGDVSVSLDVTQ
jgi:hypothetical protein